MTDILTSLGKEHWLLFAWSMLCFLCGMLFTVTLHHYYMNQVMLKANKLIEELSKQKAPLHEMPLTRKDDP